MLSMLHASTDNSKLFERSLHEESLDVDLDEEEIDIIDKPSSKLEPVLSTQRNQNLAENSTTRPSLVLSKESNVSPKEKRSRDTDKEDNSTKRFKATAEAVDASEDVDILQEDGNTTEFANPSQGIEQAEMQVSLDNIQHMNENDANIEQDEEDIDPTGIDSLPPTLMKVGKELESADLSTAAGWATLSSELLFKIFSYNCSVKQLATLMVVCKEWVIKCDSTLFWQQVCLERFPFKCNNFESISWKQDTNWKAICKKRTLIDRECSVKIISERVEQAFSLMEQVLSKRHTTGQESVLLDLNMSMVSLQHSAKVKRHLQQFTELLSHKMAQATVLEDVLFLVNNVFFTVPDGINFWKFIVLTRKAQSISFKFETAPSHKLSFIEEKGEATLFQVNHSVHVDQANITQLGRILGVPDLPPQQLLFFLINYCLPLEELTLKNSIASKICQHIGWKLEEEVDVFTSPQTSVQPDAEEEQDLEIV